MPSAPSPDLDSRLRSAALAAIRRNTERTGGVITRADMDAGFEFEGERVRFASPARGRGIWRPRQLGRFGAALSIFTASKRRGEPPKYDDQVASSEGSFEYRYQGNDPTDWDNVAVRRAFEQDLPLLYFYGVGPGLYEANAPVYVLADDPLHLTFTLAVAPASLPVGAPLTSESAALFKAYTTTIVKRRLHQHRFRELVVAAYRERCTVCSLNYPELLDAAHILEDHDERGKPEIPNGLALCKIHHGAYDVNILGISPDFRIRIRGDILENHDGPMLQHGLQAMHDMPLHLPRAAVHRPNRGYLDERFKRFLAA